MNRTFKSCDRDKIVLIQIYPYLDCFERALDYLADLGYSDEDIACVGEGEILFNLPFSVMGCQHRAIIGKDLKNQRCAYLYPSRYKVPEIFFEVIE